MARVARIVGPGMPHHVTQRGNRRQQTFFCDEDYRAYLSLLKAWCGHRGNRIWAYCLMPNHVHLTVVPRTEEGLCRGIGEAHRRYIRRVNFREGWRGYLWQGRFASVVMDEPHLMAAARYVERNPVRSGPARRAADWAWSSARGHVKSKPDPLAESHWLRERTGGWVCSWRQFLGQEEDAEWAAGLRRQERTGRPRGDEPFLRKIGRLLGRDLRTDPIGPRRPERTRDRD